MRIAIALLLAGLAAGPSHGQVPESDRQVLLALYNASNGPGWTNASGWNGPPGGECAWFGIACNGGRVVVINLQANGLAGTLPAIAALSELVQFNVRNNQLTGPLPALAGMSRLAFFTAGGNQFSGSLPSLAGLAALNTFEVSNNQLSGTCPAWPGCPP